MVALFFGIAPFGNPSALAQTGTIAGVVVDAELGETLIGANVIIQGTTTGSTTDLDGRYEFQAPVGTHTLVFSYIGFNRTVVQGVEVKEGQTTMIDISLTPEAVEVGEVVVEATALAGSDTALLRDRQKAAAVSDAISAETISRAGASDAAAAMEKVTGASVVGGKYVYVRGLGERYSSTQLNGVELPSSDPDKKAVQFDLFPSNLLDNIVTIKTFTPDKPGNFSGGLVDIGTKSFPEQFSLQFSVSSAFNTQTEFGGTFLTYDGSNTDWLGIDDGTRDLPAVLQSPTLDIPTQQEASITARFEGNNEMALKLDRLSKAFNSTMAPTTGSAPINQSYALSLGNRQALFGNQLGYVLSATYSRNASSYEDGITNRYSFAGTGATGLSPDVLFDDRRGTSEATLGGIANVTYRLGLHNKIGVNTLYLRSGESSARLQVGQWPKEFGNGDSTSLFINRTLQYTERELYSVQLRGEHVLAPLFGSTLEWTVATANTKQDEPDVRFFASTQRQIGDNVVTTANSTNFSNPQRLFRNLDEGTDNVAADLTIPFKQWSSLAASLKLGGSFQQTERDFTERAFTIVPNQDFDGDDASYFAPENMGIVDVDTLSNGNLRYTFGNVVRNASKLRNNYTGSRDIVAGYLMAEVPLTGSFKAIAGVRLETTQLEVVSQDPNQPLGDLDEMDWLPSLNLVYQVGEKMNIRAAGTRTLARPTFREIAPFESFEFVLGNFFIGNPELERTLITNGDLRWEWFHRPGEILAVSLFYKRLENPIERTVIGGTNGQIKYQNVEEATVVGAEFEIRSGFDFLSSALRHFSTGLNLSLVHSNINIPESELAIRRGINPDAEDTRELQGQSPYLLNADLSYENFEQGTTASLYFNVFGERLSQVSLGGTPDVFERPSPQLDLIFSQRFFSNVRVKFSAKNVLGQPYQEAYNFQGEDFIYQEYNPGRTFSLGVSYNLD
jgi:TonB-dependent receptor